MNDFFNAIVQDVLGWAMDKALDAIWSRWLVGWALGAGETLKGRLEARKRALIRVDDGEGDGLAASPRGILEHPFLVVIDADQHRLFAWTVLPAPSFRFHRFLLSWIIDYQAFGTRVVAPERTGAGGAAFGSCTCSV